MNVYANAVSLLKVMSSPELACDSLGPGRAEAFEVSG